MHVISRLRLNVLIVDECTGANAVEVDLVIDSSGQPTIFRHSPTIFSPCDCSCGIFLSDANVCKNIPDQTDSPNSCMTYANADLHLNSMATKPTIALVYIDPKIDQVLYAGPSIVTCPYLPYLPESINNSAMY